MEIIYLLIPLSLLLVGLIVWIFIWAIRSGQFDDMDSPSWRIIFDDREDRRGSDNADKPSSDDPY